MGTREQTSLSAIYPFLYISFINNRYLFPSGFVLPSKSRTTKPFFRFFRFRKNRNKLGNSHRNRHGNKMGTGCYFEVLFCSMLFGSFFVPISLFPHRSHPRCLPGGGGAEFPLHSYPVCPQKLHGNVQPGPQMGAALILKRIDKHRAPC